MALILGWHLMSDNKRLDREAGMANEHETKRNLEGMTRTAAEVEGDSCIDQ